MAKRRRSKTKTRTVVRTVSRSAPKKMRRRSKSSAFSGLTGVVVGGMAYGGLREYASNQLAALTKGTTLSFLGNYSDEVTMGFLSYLMMKGKIPLLNKIPMTREIGKAGLYIESARAGSQLFSNVVTSKAPSVASNTLR